MCKFQSNFNVKVLQQINLELRKVIFRITYWSNLICFCVWIPVLQGKILIWWFSDGCDLKMTMAVHIVWLFIFLFIYVWFFIFLFIYLFYLGFLSRTSWITGLPGKGEGISLTPHHHFHLLHRHLDISWATTAESSPLHIASGRSRTGNFWFLSASC